MLHLNKAIVNAPKTLIFALIFSYALGLHVLKAQTVTHFLRLKDKTASNELAFNPEPGTAAYQLFFPATVPTLGSVLTVNALNGSGNTNAKLSWINPNTISWGLAGNTANSTSFLGTTDNNPLRFRTNNTERMTLLPSGYLGIGTTTPVGQLANTNTNIIGSNGQGTATFLMSSTAPGWAGAFYATGSTQNGLNVKVNSNGANIALEVGAGLTAQQNNGGSGGSTPLFDVLGNGNVGIGTNTPTATFEVFTTNGLSAVIRRAGPAVHTPANVILQKTAGVNPTTNVALPDGDHVGRILFSAANGTGYSTTGTAIIGYASGQQSLTNNGGGIAFRTVPLNNTDPAVERMRIEHNGNVGVGTINPISKFEVNGAATNTNSIVASSTNIDFSLSNLAGTTANAGAFILTNLKDGGSYTLAVKGTVSGTATFTATNTLGTALTVHLPADNGPTTAGKHSLYGFIVIGTDVYVSWLTGL